VYVFKKELVDELLKEVDPKQGFASGRVDGGAEEGAGRADAERLEMDHHLDQKASAEPD
jgi:hypothetical protein